MAARNYTSGVLTSGPAVPTTVPWCPAAAPLHSLQQSGPHLPLAFKQSVSAQVCALTRVWNLLGKKGFGSWKWATGQQSSY